MRKFTKYPSNYVSSASETSGAAMRKKRREAEQRGREGAELLATDGEWELWTPTTFDGSVYLAGLGGDKAVWDTAYEGGGSRYFDAYNSRGPLYIFINKNNPSEKYQSHPATSSWFYDRDDRNLGKEALEDFCCEHPAFAEFFDVSCDDAVSQDSEFPGHFLSDGYFDNIESSTKINASFFVNDVIPIARDGEWEMYQPYTFEACKELSDGAQWCTGYDERYFNQYTNKGPMYIFINKSTGEKYQSHPASGSWFYDADDRNLGKEALGEFLDQHPNFIVNEFKDLLMEYGRNGWTWNKETADGAENPGWFLSNIESATEIEAARVKSRYDQIRDALGEEEWSYIEDYLINEDDRHSLNEILTDVDAWDDYCEWKMKKYHKKPLISASTRIKASRYLR